MLVGPLTLWQACSSIVLRVKLSGILDKAGEPIVTG